VGCRSLLVRLFTVGVLLVVSSKRRVNVS
jgi:hypothetical protein